MEDKTTLKDLDQWIEQLNECKQLTETQVKTLCDMVSDSFTMNSTEICCIFFKVREKIFIMHVTSPNTGIFQVWVPLFFFWYTLHTAAFHRVRIQVCNLCTIVNFNFMAQKTD